jgi:phosphinothricin acetyltransferase
MSIKIRPASSSDAGGILAVYGPYCSTSPVSFEIVPPTEEQIRERLERVTAWYPWLVAEIDGEVAGYVYATQHRERAAYRWAAEVAVYVADSHHRRGIGRALYSALFELLLEQGYFQAYAGITLPNAASVNLHESVGFKPIAVYESIGYKHGRWLDVGWWQLQLRPKADNPAEPRPFSTIAPAKIAKTLRQAEQQAR